MLPFENMVADYLKETNNHVLYRVTPIFKDNELVARGVTIEAYSIEDHGRRNSILCVLLQQSTKSRNKLSDRREQGNCIFF